MSWQNRVLWIDLDRRECRIEPLNLDWARRYIGQRGLGSKYLFEGMDPSLDALDPANLLIFATGPLTASQASTSSRYSVITKGALTGTIACSNSGGRFGAELKLAGYDLLILRGRSPEPVYLLIRDGEVSIESANQLWGLGVWDVEERLRRQHLDPELKFASIGRAGELGVRYACIINDRDRAAGRSGVGAVMGSKNLKTIAVRGRRGLKAGASGELATTIERVNGRLAGSRRRQNLARNGTQAMMAIMQEFGGLPTRNFQAVQFDGARRIDAKAMWRTGADGHRNMIRNAACFACTIACQRVSHVNPQHWSVRDRPKYRGAGGGLEYETAFAFGSMIGVDDIDALTFAGFLANEHGLDPISFGGSLAAAMELYERGIIDREETQGLELRFGSARALTAAIEATATGRGFGPMLGVGAKRLCEHYGHPELAMHVKGQEFAGYDPRALQGMGLGYATSNRGACHMKHDVFAQDMSTPGPAGKASACKSSQDRIAVIDSSGLCCFPESVGWQLHDYGELLNAACDMQWTVEELLEIGERIWNLERLFNLKAGFKRKDDTLPERLLHIPAPSGQATGRVCELEIMLDEYYALRGWNRDGSLPEALIGKLRL